MNKIINFAYDDVLIYKGKTPAAFAPPFWGQLDPKYLCWPHSIYNKSKVEIEKEYNITFPLTIEEGDDTYNELYISLHDNIMNYPFCGYEFTYDSYKNFIDKNEKFVYAINVASGGFFECNYDEIQLEESLIKATREGQCGIVFFIAKEGHFKEPFQFKWLNDFCKKYGFNKDNVYLFSGNLLTKQEAVKYEISKKEKLLFSVVHDLYFEHIYWFVKPGTKFNFDERTRKYTQFNNELDYVRCNSKKYHFLCFNRRMDLHRLITYGQLNVNPKLIGKSIASLHNSHGTINEEIYRWIDGEISAFHPDREPRLKELKYGNQIANFLSQIDYSVPTIYDEDPVINLAGSLNIEAHRASFVNIITETLYYEKCVFISEKLFKPIHLCQPFIIVGNPYTLRELKKLGYKTFDKWWDESYDDEIDFMSRMAKLEEVYEHIASYSTEDLFAIQQEMEDVLINNFNVMMDLTRHRENTNILAKLSN